MTFVVVNVGLVARLLDDIGALYHCCSNVSRSFEEMIVA